MNRMSRAGRVIQIKSRMWAIKKRTGQDKFITGEISRLVGVKSSTWFKTILDEMVREGELVKGYTALDGFNHEVAYYSLPTLEQLRLPERWIMINGQPVRMS